MQWAYQEEFREIRGVMQVSEASRQSNFFLISRILSARWNPIYERETFSRRARREGEKTQTLSVCWSEAVNDRAGN